MLVNQRFFFQLVCGHPIRVCHTRVTGRILLSLQRRSGPRDFFQLKLWKAQPPNSSQHGIGRSYFLVGTSGKCYPSPPQCVANRTNACSLLALFVLKWQGMAVRGRKRANNKREKRPEGEEIERRRIKVMCMVFSVQSPLPRVQALLHLPLFFVVYRHLMKTSKSCLVWMRHTRRGIPSGTILQSACIHTPCACICICYPRFICKV